MSLKKALWNASDVLVSHTFGAKIAKSSHARSSRANIVALSLSRRETASIPDVLPAAGMMKC